MAGLLPENEGSTNVTIAEQQPSYTFAFDLGRKVMRGKCDGEQALRQAIYLILFTDRYKWIIHNNRYGHEMAGLFGQPMTYAISEAERLITEALMQDDRIDNVSDFKFAIGETRNNLLVDFTVTTNLAGIGDIRIESIMVDI